MKVILNNPSNNTFPANLVSQTDGVFLKYKITQFFAAGGGYICPPEIRNEIDSYAQIGKIPYVSVQWGAACGNYIWNKYPWIELTEKRKEGTDPSLPKHKDKFPVPYDPKFLLEVHAFLDFFSSVLGVDLREFMVMKVTGINEVTFEFRVPNQDFKNTDDVVSAYLAGLDAWKALGYTNTNMRLAMQTLLSYYNIFFPKTMKVVSPIAGSNGFPKINDNGFFDIDNTPILVNDLITYMKLYNNFSIMPTALFKDGGTPNNMVKSGLPLKFQLNNDNLNKTTTAEELDGAFARAYIYGADAVEVYKINVTEHPEIIAKWRAK